MNQQQRLYLVQARSDRWILRLLDREPVCHQLHYLQMLTEKLGKAFFWRGPGAENLGHAAFVRFLRAIAANQRVAEGVGFTSVRSFGEWIEDVLPLAFELERLAPALAADGPNPEYPWPRALPEHTPAEHDFVFWRHFRSRSGFTLFRMLDLILDNFEAWF
jgi:hypothetical protein